MRQTMSFLSILFSVFLISSCHYIGKSCCAKKSGDQRLQYKKKCCKDKKHWSIWKKKSKKSCCGQGSTAGFSSVKSLDKGKITGSVFFERTGRYEVKVTANIKGLAPNKKFGFHVHEFGTCENKGLLAGGHLNPWGEKHAGPQDKNKHLGDLGNLKSDQLGTAVYSISVKGKLDKFMGRSVIIHAEADDMKSQPTGNSGDRIACGVITASMPPIQEEKQAEESVVEEKKAVSTKTTAPEQTVSSKKETSTVVEKAVSSEKPMTPVQAVSTKETKASVEKAVSNKKAEIQKTSGVSSVKTETSQTSPKK